MTDLLIKIFIKNSEITDDNNTRTKYALLTSWVGIILNTLLSIIKIIIGVLSSSMSIISDALNNFTDAGSSIVTMLGFKMSQKQEDDEHPWGHGRMEYVSAFIVDILIVLVGFELLQSSVSKIINPVAPSISSITIIFLVMSILVKFWLFLFYNKIAKIIDSNAVKSVAYDSISDVVATSVVLIAGIVLKIWNLNIDGYVSLLVSIFILTTGIKAIKDTIDLLLGVRPNKEFVNEIYNFSKKYELIYGIHDIMVHDYGPERKIVSFHAEVPENENIGKIHDIIDSMEEDMYKEFGCITTIHMDPIVTDDEQVNIIKMKIENIVKEMNPEFSIHDFRMVDGEKKTNLIFDLVIPRDKNLKKSEIDKEIKKKIKEIDPKYGVVIKIEGAFV